MLVDQIVALYDQYYFILGSALALVQLVLIIEVAFVHARLSKVKRNYDRLFKDARGQSLEKLLGAHVARVEGDARRIDELTRDFRHLAENLRNTIQHVGLVRFNPYNDTGGDQSFSIAFLDDLDTGIVITSLYNREVTRVYAKPIQNGQPLYALSNEEKEAIESARRS